MACPKIGAAVLNGLSRRAQEKYGQESYVPVRGEESWGPQKGKNGLNISGRLLFAALSRNVLDGNLGCELLTLYR